MKLFFYLFALLTTLSLQAKTKEFQLHFYHGIPGCQCFLHCPCYTTSSPNGISYKSRCSFQSEQQNELWHSFIEKLWDMHRDARYSCGDSTYPYNSCGTLGKMVELFHSHEATDSCLLSDYLNNLHRFSQIVDEDRDHCLFLYSKWREEGRDKVKEDSYVILEAKKQQESISKFRFDIIQQYRYLQGGCTHFDHPQNLAYIYNEGLLSMMYGEMHLCLENIKKFIKFCKENHRVELLTSSVYQQKGDAYFAVGMYNKAIKALTKAIQKDPANKDAYFSRAQSYFERGQFDQALEDYLASGRSKSANTAQRLAPLEFRDALLEGIYEGAKESAADFFPSLYYSACGLNESLWVFVSHPIDSTKHFVNQCYELSENVYQNLKAIAALDKQKLDKITVELREFYERFDQLSNKEKGDLIGRAIGKYGLDIFVTRGAGKGARGLKSLATVRKVKDANIVCNLEAMAASGGNKEAMIQKIAERQAQKAAIRKELKIEVDKQNKHIVGKHNYEAHLNRSILEHTDPQGLINKSSGTGRPLNQATLGSPGYKEKVNCGEFVGYFVNDKTLEKTPTTWATIHYSKKGVHIVPAIPE